MMKYQIISFLLIVSLGPSSLGVPDPAPVMIFDVSRVPTVESMIIAESSRAGISAHLPLAIAMSESWMRPNLIGRNRNGTRDWGLFQLNDHTVRVLHIAHPLDPQQNIIAGVGLVAAYLKMCRSDQAARYAFAHGRCPSSSLEHSK
jgi:membrane-bound lytic murein transglycosylase MltF